MTRIISLVPGFLVRLIPAQAKRNRRNAIAANPPKELMETQPDAGQSYAHGKLGAKLHEEAARWNCTVEEAWRLTWGGEVIVRDLGSRNGTWVGDKASEPPQAQKVDAVARQLSGP